MTEYQPTPQGGGNTNALDESAHEQERSGLHPRIYVASLADYNAGTLHGRWIDAVQDADQIWEQVRAMLAESRLPLAEEWAIHDYNEFGGLRIDECESLETVSAIAKGIAEYGEAFAAWANMIGIDEAAKNADQFADCYMGHFDSLTAFAEEQWESLGYDEALEAVPVAIRGYLTIDFAMWARDVQLEGSVDYVEDSNGVHAFWNE